MGRYPTVYPDVNAHVERLLALVRAALGENFVGMYLYGSLATRDFRPESSDIDVLIATREDVSEVMFAALARMHHELATTDAKWGEQVEAAYLPLDALRRHDPANALHPYLDRGGSELVLELFEADWVSQRAMLREHGIDIAGPDIRTLIDPVSPDELRAAMHNILDIWWGEPMIAHLETVHAGYRTYAVMTLCRILYTLEHGRVVSKTAATDWAQATLDPHWRDLIALAATHRNGTDAVTVERVQGFVRYVLSRVAADDGSPQRRP